ncbi:15887_t:CDS:1, partial [Racocetra fulgida]
TLSISSPCAADFDLYFVSGAATSDTPDTYLESGAVVYSGS